MLSAGVEEGQQSTPCPDRLAVPPEGGGLSGDSSGRSTLLSGTHKASISTAYSINSTMASIPLPSLFISAAVCATTI